MSPKLLNDFKLIQPSPLHSPSVCHMQPQWAAMHPDELSSEAQHSANAVEEVEAISTFEETFQRIKEATGVTDSRVSTDRNFFLVYIHYSSLVLSSVYSLIIGNSGKVYLSGRNTGTFGEDEGRK